MKAFTLHMTSNLATLETSVLLPAASWNDDSSEGLLSLQALSMFVGQWRIKKLSVQFEKTSPYWNSKQLLAI